MIFMHDKIAKPLDRIRLFLLPVTSSRIDVCTFLEAKDCKRKPNSKSFGIASLFPFLYGNLIP